MFKDYADVMWQNQLAITSRKAATVLGCSIGVIHNRKKDMERGADYRTEFISDLSDPTSGKQFNGFKRIVIFSEAGFAKLKRAGGEKAEIEKPITLSEKETDEEPPEYLCPLYDDESKDTKESPERGGKLYTADEEAAIRVGVKLGHTNDEIAAYLHRTKGAIENVKNKLGLVSAPSHKWTKEMDIIAQTLRGLGRTFEEISKVMGVTPDAVKSRLKKLRMKAKNEK